MHWRTIRTMMARTFVARCLRGYLDWQTDVGLLVLFLIFLIISVLWAVVTLT